VPKIELGPLGIAVSPAPAGALTMAAAAIEEFGFSTIWVTGGPLSGLEQLAGAVRATTKPKVASGILSVDRFSAAEVLALYDDLEGTDPGRFVVGLGGAHGSNPLQTLEAYLDRLDGVSVTARVLAALGPRMLDLARRRAAGALPVLITPEYTAQARARLGDDTTLAVEQFVVLDRDPDRARQIARRTLGFLSTVPVYPASFRRMGFTNDEIATLADHLVDALVVWGDYDVVRSRVAEHVAAGADHVALSVLTATPDSPPIDEWRRLAGLLR
jgi:probable F420-dependent oxidoreductase